MNEQTSRLNERTERIREFVTSYQETLRTLAARLPDDGALIPLPIAAALGRCEIWPCKDAAVVLTYDDDSEAPVAVQDSVDIKFSEFTKEGDLFTFFNENGERVPISISFQPNSIGVPPGMIIPADDFSFSSFSVDHLITWWPQGESDALDLSRIVCRPRFKRLSLFGWNAWNGNPRERARQTFREGSLINNMLGSGQEALNPKGREMIFSVADKLISEYEALLDGSDADEQARNFLAKHPELIRAEYLRCYQGTNPGEDTEPDLLLLVLGEEEDLEWTVIKLGGVTDRFFTELNEPSESLAKAKSILSTCAEHITRHLEQLVPVTTDIKKLSYQFVMGRNSGLSYKQRKQLRQVNSSSNHKVYTYDDLVNRFRFQVNDVIEIRERYLPVDIRLARLNIKTDEDFNRVMEEIDQEMQAEGIPLTARDMKGWLRFSSTYGLNLMGRDPLSIKIYTWFIQRYEERLKLDSTLGSMGVILRGSLYRMYFPVAYGHSKVVAQREITKERPPIVIGTQDNPPILNVLDFVDGLTQDYANSLTDEELEGLFNQFVFGLTVFMEISGALIKDAMGAQARNDLNASSNHLFSNPPNYGLSKWSSQQAAEKFIRAFILSRGGVPPSHHHLKELAQAAELLGLPSMPDQWFEDIQCSAEVSSGDIPITALEAIEAQYVALQIGELIAGAQ